MEKQKTQNNQHNTEEEKQSQRTDNTPLQDLVYICSNQDTDIGEKRDRWMEQNTEPRNRPI